MDDNIVTVPCYNPMCKGLIAFTKEAHARLLNTGVVFYCPVGHAQCFPKQGVLSAFPSPKTELKVELDDNAKVDVSK